MYAYTNGAGDEVPGAMAAQAAAPGFTHHGDCGPRGSQHTPYCSRRKRHWLNAQPHNTRTTHSSAPAVYKIKPLFRMRAKGRTTRYAASDRIKVSRRLVCEAGAAGPAPAATSKAPEIKGAAARSASVIIIMQALWGARDSSERATRAARAPRRLPPHPAARVHLSAPGQPRDPARPPPPIISYTMHSLVLFVHISHLI